VGICEIEECEKHQAYKPGDTCCDNKSILSLLSDEATLGLYLHCTQHSIDTPLSYISKLLFNIDDCKRPSQAAYLRVGQDGGG
jgi:hypothetical protein